MLKNSYAAKLAVFGHFSGLSPIKTHSFAHSLVHAHGVIKRESGVNPEQFPLL